MTIMNIFAHNIKYVYLTNWISLQSTPANYKMEGNKTLHILLADDDEDDRSFFQMALDKLEFPGNLKTVRDGEQLMDYLDEYSDSLPDVLFLDLNMPRKNGSECLNEIMASDKLKQLPVIIYSTSLNDTIGNVLYNQGAHYYVQKCEFNELAKLLHKVLTEMIETKFVQPARDRFFVNFVSV